MKHIIIGYGYCGYYLAELLLTKQCSVQVVSRSSKALLPGVTSIQLDITKQALPVEDTIWYYMVPPNAQGQENAVLKQFLSLNPVLPKKIIYVGSSGVYGNHQGNWVDESSPCHIQFDRQKRRLHAESLWGQSPGSVLLRVAGIYGPNRLPIQAALDQKPILMPEQAPWSNLIYVKDLVRAAYLLGQAPQAQGIYNVSDGTPCKMGTLQALTAKALGQPAPPCETLSEALSHASPMRKEFISSSKRLDNSKIARQLGSEFKFTQSQQAIIDSIATEV